MSGGAVDRRLATGPGCARRFLPEADRIAIAHLLRTATTGPPLGRPHAGRTQQPRALAGTRVSRQQPVLRPGDRSTSAAPEGRGGCASGESRTTGAALAALSATRG